MKSIFQGVLVAMALAGTASAATLQVDASGELFGATGVDVAGTLYDVEFIDGTCAAIFSGCDDISDFTFQSETTALAAGQALLDVVFVDGAQGNFDSDLSLTRGINNIALAGIFTPYEFRPWPNSAPLLRVSTALNYGSSSSLADIEYLSTIVLTLDTSTKGTSAYAVWTEQTIAPVPLPAGGLLLLTGLGGVAFLKRRKMHVV